MLPGRGGEGTPASVSEPPPADNVTSWPRAVSPSARSPAPGRFRRIQRGEPSTGGVTDAARTPLFFLDGGILSHGAMAFGFQRVDGCHDVSEHLVGVLVAVDLDDQAASSVEIQERCRLGLIDAKAVVDRGLHVVGASLLPGPAQEPAAKFVAAHLEVNDRLQLDALDLLRHPVRLLGLAKGAGEPVEHVATVSRRLENGAGDHLQHHLVGHQVASPQVVRGDLPDRCPAFDFSSEKIPAGQVGDLVVGGQELGLGALSGTRWADQQQAHRGQPKDGDGLRDRGRCAAAPGAMMLRAKE